MKKPKSILPRLAALEGNLDEELARLALLRSQGKLLWPGGKADPKKQNLRTRLDWFRTMIKVSDKGCWDWQGQLGDEGYGVIDITCLTFKAHRFSFVIFNGREPENYVCHRCDNPKCVNPDHLFDGTAKDNRRDCVKKNRHASRKGEKNIKAKLTPQDVLFIRSSTERTIVLAEKFGVCQVNIQLILAGKTWHHLLPTDGR